MSRVYQSNKTRFKFEVIPSTLLPLRNTLLISPAVFFDSVEIGDFGRNIASVRGDAGRFDSEISGKILSTTVVGIEGGLEEEEVGGGLEDEMGASGGSVVNSESSH